MSALITLPPHFSLLQSKLHTTVYEATGLPIVTNAQTAIREYVCTAVSDAPLNLSTRSRCQV